MRIIVTLATTGNTLMDVCSGRFDAMRAWQLREYFVRYIEGVYFEWLFVVQNAPMSDTVQVHLHADRNSDTGETVLEVQAVRRKVTALTARDMVNLLPAIIRQDRLQLWTVLREGKYVPRPSPRGQLLSNPLLLVMRHADAVEIMRDETAAALPDPLHLFLLASGDPNEMSHGVSPLCHALRAGDASSVSLLLRYWANPVQCELGQSDPIFIAIRGDFPQGVRLLLNYRANTEAHQNYVALADSSGPAPTEVILRSRTTSEAAADYPRILLMLQEAGRKLKLHL